MPVALPFANPAFWADALTASRFVLGPAAVVAARSPASTAIMLVGWTADVLDGRLARLARGETHLRSKWWDLLADAALGVGGLVALVRSGRLPGRALGLYLAGAASFVAAGPSRWRVWLVEAPLAPLFALASARAAPRLGLLYLAWGLAALLTNRRRAREVVRLFRRDVIGHLRPA